MKKAKVILIGCGPHSRRVYLPAIKNIKDMELVMILDLKSQESIVTDSLRDYPNAELKLIEPFKDDLPNELWTYLSNYIKEKEIQGVIIATEPLVHKAYASWAIQNELNVLIDKPITARGNVVSDMSNAEGILEDYLELYNNYSLLQLRKETIFIVNSQRRFHAGFEFVKKLIREVGEETNCPVTFIQAYHCDGQWRLPNEIITQEYHPYCFGYGKASHSGYHIFDSVYQFYKASEIENKVPDSMEIMSSFIQPEGFFEQLTENDYLKIFGEDYLLIRDFDEQQIKSLTRDFGEIDLSAVITLKMKEVSIANININLLHNGYAGRTWLKPGADLYKGNGRIKHETYNIQQGPFQNIQIHAYQADDKHDKNNEPEYFLGGKNHFEVYVFRNPLISSGANQPKIYSYQDIIGSSFDNCTSQVTMEKIKFKIVEDFADYISGKKEKVNIHSQIEDHMVPVQIMSGIYKSNILRKNIGQNFVKTNWGMGKIECNK